MQLEDIGTRLKFAIDDFSPITLKGRVTQVTGTVIRAIVPQAGIGEICLLGSENEEKPLYAEVVGFDGDTAILTPMGNLTGISAQTVVTATGTIQKIPVGEGLLGRIINGMGQALDTDEKGPLRPSDYYPAHADPPDPLKRNLISKPLSVGVKAIDTLCTVGEGQRIGIFAAAGTGKSTLMGMLQKNADVDVTVVALIGERGREVREFIEEQLGPEGMRRAVVVVATSDRPAGERAKAAFVATTISEYFRNQGKRVLLLMDSITRFARAQREIGLAAGEAPTRRGFPPSVFSTLPQLLERTGNSDRGSITAFYTVLVEGDDMNEPVADETRSILDGHIILSRKLAAANHYPPIDVASSLSRVMTAVASPEHLHAASRVRELMAKYQEIELLVRVGEYKRGQDTQADEALDKHEIITGLLKQMKNAPSTFDESLQQLIEIVGE